MQVNRFLTFSLEIIKNWQNLATVLVIRLLSFWSITPEVNLNNHSSEVDPFRWFIENQKCKFRAALPQTTYTLYKIGIENFGVRIVKILLHYIKVFCNNQLLYLDLNSHVKWKVTLLRWRPSLTNLFFYQNKSYLKIR